MGFEEFTEKLKAMLKDKLEGFDDVTVEEPVCNNGSKEKRICIVSGHNKAISKIPLEVLYSSYLNGKCINDLVQFFIENYEREYDSILNIDVSFYFDYDRVKDRLFCKMVNYEKNKELLCTHPFVRWNDLAVIFCCTVDRTTDDNTIIVVTNEHMETWGKDVSEIYEDAVKNHKDNALDTLTQVSEILSDSGCEWMPLYALTDNGCPFGAASVLYSDIFQKFAAKTESDLFILPSSVYELLIIPACYYKSIDTLREIVHEVNSTALSAEEFLSDNVYLYNRENEGFNIV